MHFNFYMVLIVLIASNYLNKYSILKIVLGQYETFLNSRHFYTGYYQP